MARSAPWLLLLLALCSCGRESLTRPQNVILLSIDTLRPDHLGAYGYGRPTSPTIDAFAASGAVFEDCSAPSPWTLPSHASLFTGLYPSRHGVKSREQRLQGRFTTLASRLAEAGFATHAIVNAIYLRAKFGLDHGFEGYDHALNRDAETVTDAGLAWLARQRERPFFLFLHYYDVHSDYAPAEPYRTEFLRPYDGSLTGISRELTELRSSGREPTDGDVRFLIDLYDAEIRQLDAELARLRDFLEREGLVRNTLVVITSDHGEEFGDHGSLLHGRTQYQEVLAVPLIVTGPNVAAGTRVSRPVSLLDVAPTVLAMFGLDFPTPVNGRSLVPHLTGNTPGAERLFFGEADHNNELPDQTRMVRRGAYKLCFDRASEAAELFDLGRDPAEHKDLAGEQPRRVEELLEALAAFEQGGIQGEALDQPLTPEELRRLEALGY